MLDFFQHLFSQDFMPHGHCYFWQPGVLWLTVIADALIFVAYYTIPLALVYLVRKRRDIAFDWMFVMFGVFICACGTTHLLDVITVWKPIYRFAALVKAITATASVFTAFALWQLMPRLIALPSPAQLRESNSRLETEVVARKTAEEALLASNDTLEQRVRERTAELARANEELRARMAEREQVEGTLVKAREEAERANNAKSEFLSRMSHELRTPLNAILGFAQVMEMDNPTPTEMESISQVLRAGRHLLLLINEVLDIARVDAGRMNLSLEPVDTAEVVREVFFLMRPLADQQSVQLTNHFGTDVPWVLADRQRLKQVLLNLVSNAVKFNRPQGTVTFWAEPAGDNRLRLSVRDTGPGIAPNDQQKIFEAFERLQADQRGIEGSGLGLALAKRLTEAIGGQIGLRSQPGEGTTFWIELPTASPLAPPPHHDEPGGTPASDAAESSPQRTILYIEDNESNMSLMEKIFKRRTGLRMIPAMQGLLGLNLAREHKPDIILLDMNLPDMHGRDVLRRLRNDEATRHTPVLVISADAVPREVELALAEGAQAYLTKPLDVIEFLRILNEHLTTPPPAPSPA